MFSSRLDLLLRNATNSACFNFIVICRVSSSIYVHKSLSSVFHLLSRKDGGHTRVKNPSFIKTHPVPVTMNTASGTVPVQLTIHASDRSRSRRDVSKTTWYFFLVPRYDITIFFSIKEVLRPFSAYPSTTWVRHKELTNACREDILIAAILWDKNIQCNLLETGCGLWNLSIALTWNIFLGLATLSISADCNIKYAYLSWRLTWIARESLLRVTHFAPK